MRRDIRRNDQFSAALHAEKIALGDHRIGEYQKQHPQQKQSFLRPWGFHAADRRQCRAGKRRVKTHGHADLPADAQDGRYRRPCAKQGERHAAYQPIRMAAILPRIYEKHDMRDRKRRHAANEKTQPAMPVRQKQVADTGSEETGRQPQMARLAAPQAQRKGQNHADRREIIMARHF